MCIYIYIYIYIHIYIYIAIDIWAYLLKFGLAASTWGFSHKAPLNTIAAKVPKKGS